MTRQAAKAFYDVQAGDPATGYITPADAQAALDVVYDDMAAVSVARITGSPNGVRTANPGDEVIQTDATTDVKGFIRWIKTGAPGSNTGWIPSPEADTGWRNVSALITGYTSPLAFVRRQGNQVSFSGGSNGATPVLAGGWNTLLTLPAGFRPFTGLVTLWNAGFASDIRRGMINDLGAVQLFGAGASVAACGMSTVFDTPNPWPSTLPGTPA